MLGGGADDADLTDQLINFTPSRTYDPRRRKIELARYAISPATTK